MLARCLFVATVIGLAAIAPALSASEPPAGTAACSGCHPANTGVDTAVPRLAGRPAADIVSAMQAFRSGQRPTTIMDRFAKGLSDAEVEAIAAWYAEQR